MTLLSFGRCTHSVVVFSECSLCVFVQSTQSSHVRERLINKHNAQPCCPQASSSHILVQSSSNLQDNHLILLVFGSSKDFVGPV